MQTAPRRPRLDPSFHPIKFREFLGQLQEADQHSTRTFEHDHVAVLLASINALLNCRN